MVDASTKLHNFLYHKKKAAQLHTQELFEYGCTLFPPQRYQRSKRRW